MGTGATWRGGLVVREPLHYVTVRPGLFGGSVEPGVYVHAAEVAAILRDTYAYDPYDVDAFADELDALASAHD